MPTPKKNKLSPAEKTFVEAYTNPESPTKLNATKSYLKAYPNSTYQTANSAGFRVLERPTVQKNVKEVLDSLNLTEKVCLNMNKLVEAAAKADAGNWKQQKLGLEAGQFIKDVYGWKQPEQHLHVTVTPEDREKEYEAIADLVQKKQLSNKKMTVDAQRVPPGHEEETKPAISNPNS